MIDRKLLLRDGAEWAARLLGAAGALRDALGSPLPPVDRADRDRSLAAARAVLGEAAFAAASAERRAMELEQAVADTLEGAR